MCTTPFKLHRDKTNKMACAPSKDSDPSLISLRCALNGQLRILAFFKQTAKTLIRLGGCSGWSESSLGAHAIFFFFCYNVAQTLGNFIFFQRRWRGVLLFWTFTRSQFLKQFPLILSQLKAILSEGPQTFIKIASHQRLCLFTLKLEWSRK